MPSRRTSRGALAWSGALAAAVAAAGLLGACDTNDGRELSPAGPDQTVSVVNSTTTTVPPNPPALGSGLPGEGVGEGDLTLRAPWPDEGAIDLRFTCEGGSGPGVSPSLAWSGVPTEASNLALVVTDLSANGFVHWVVVGVDPTLTGIDEGVAPTGAQGANGFGDVGWGGPCPPAGSGEHEYLIQLHALGEDLALVDGFDGEAAIAEIEAASIGTVSVVGRFSAQPTTTSSAATTTLATTAATSAGAAVSTTPPG